MLKKNFYKIFWSGFNKLQFFKIPPMKSISKKFLVSSSWKTRQKSFFFGNWANNKFERPTLIDSISELKPKILKSGSFHCALLTEENKLYTFGENKYGQCATHGYFLENPTEIEGKFSQISLGKEFTLATNEEETIVYSTGLNDRGQVK
jgi:alpha-tubulin suppressor-like RCC1 family protein